MSVSIINVFLKAEPTKQFYSKICMIYYNFSDTITGCLTIPYLNIEHYRVGYVYVMLKYLVKHDTLKLSIIVIH